MFKATMNYTWEDKTTYTDEDPSTGGHKKITITAKQREAKRLRLIKLVEQDYPIVKHGFHKDGKEWWITGELYDH